MNGSHTLDASLIDTLHSANPEFQVGVDGVLDKHGHIHSFERVCQVLHGKGIGCCACAYPQDVYAIFQTEFHMLGLCHFGRYEHAGLFLDTLQPGQRLFTFTFKTTWLGSGFPHTGAEVMTSFSSQLSGCFHYLFFTFSRTRTGYDQRAFVIARQIKREKIQFHIIRILMCCFIVIYHHHARPPMRLSASCILSSWAQSEILT